MILAKCLLLCISVSSLHSFRLTRSPNVIVRTSKETISPLTVLRSALEDNIIGLDAPESVLAKSAKDLDGIDEADYVVIGSGIGGLSAAALLSYYGYSVVVLESHYLPGGVAHSFKRDGFLFDAGPSLWNGMATKPYNPLREVLDTIECVLCDALCCQD